MNKKAVTMAFVMIMMLFLLVAILLILFINNVFEKAEAKTIEDKCRVSAMREAQINELTAKASAAHTAVDFASNLNCEIIPVEITEKSERKISGLTRSLMEDCWKIFGSGKRKFFSRIKDYKRKFCHKCYSVTYEKGTSFDMRSSLEKRSAAFGANYEVPDTISGNQAVVYYYEVVDEGTIQKVIVAPFDALDSCAGAEFPPERLT